MPKKDITATSNVMIFVHISFIIYGYQRSINVQQSLWEYITQSRDLSSESNA